MSNHTDQDQKKLEAKDARNKKLILSFKRSAFTYGLHPYPYDLVERGTPEERSNYVAAVGRRLFYAVLAITVFFIAVGLQPDKSSPPAVEVWTKPVGNIVSIQLHETALSTSTTVVTAEGTFQVRGAVSAAPGDAVVMQRDEAPAALKQSKICVTSDIKSSCYSLL
jgi:hypothetical protein